MSEENTNNTNGLLAKEKINDAEEEKIDTQNLEEINDGNEFKGYTSSDKYKLFGLFFAIGIINHLGTILVMTGGRLLAYSLEMKDYVPIYISASIIFAFLTRIINSKLCVKISYKKRIYFLCFWMMAGYFIMFLVLLLHDTVLSDYHTFCFILSFIPCLFLGSSYAFGESAMLAYLRLYPKSLIAGWASGTGLSGIFGSLLNFLSQLIENFTLKYLYLILIPVGPIYIFLFELTFRIYRSHEKNIVQNKNNMELTALEGDTVEDLENNEMRGKNEGKEKNKDINEQNEDEKESENKELENMNKGNKIMSLDNFVNVMRACGEIIVNLGLISFLTFFCFNSLVIRICEIEDISFLPIDNKTNVRKGKYEFIGLFFQLGMFISKTVIQLVRKIRPIEVYTIVVFIINIIFIIEYYTGFFGWGNYIWICLVLGFFSGGTYAGGFYAILNSDKVKENYKELSVNVATLFNDTGTFFSGIAGFLALNCWFEEKDSF
jgi:hypothetical protein